jgi:hypothetical protein
MFFKGCGINDALVQEPYSKFRKDAGSINKFEIVRIVLMVLNERGDRALRERREILKRVSQFEDFSTCWPDDQLKAKGLVSEIRRVIGTKDSFTRIEQEREEERKQRIAEQNAKSLEIKERRSKLAIIRADLFALFTEENPQKRGKALESVLNRLFQVHGILVRDAFTLTSPNDGGIVEQIDGVIELDSQVYLVELRWWNTPLGPGEVAQHLVRIFNRGHARGIFISASGYTDAAIEMCRESLQKSVVALCKLEEIVLLLEQDADLKDLLRTKVRAAIIEKRPLFEPLRIGAPHVVPK